jgi:hypothetical protein
MAQELPWLEMLNIQGMLDLYCCQWPHGCNQPRKNTLEPFPIFVTRLGSVGVE